MASRSFFSFLAKRESDTGRENLPHTAGQGTGVKEGSAASASSGSPGGDNGRQDWAARQWRRFLRKYCGVRRLQLVHHSTGAALQSAGTYSLGIQESARDRLSRTWPIDKQDERKKGR